MDLVIARESPRTGDVVALLEAHLAFAAAQSPAEHVHALDLDGLCHPSVAFFTARRNSDLLGVGALKLLGPERAELKSMHTAAAARGQGVGRIMVAHLTAEARLRGCRWLGLETGTGEAFTPAHRLYAAAGFVDCEPFGPYTRNPWSRCMALDLTTVTAVDGTTGEQPERRPAAARVWNSANLSGLGRAFFVHCWAISYLHRLGQPVPPALIDEVHHIDAGWDREAEASAAVGPATEATRQAQHRANTDEARLRAELSPTDRELVAGGDWYGGDRSEAILYRLAASRFTTTGRQVPTIVLERLQALDGAVDGSG